MKNKMTPYQEILKSIGWPQEVLVLDFESFYDQDYTLSKMSTIEYITDNRFDFTGLGTQVITEKGSSPVFVGKPELNGLMDILLERFGDNLENVVVVAQNAKFDITILQQKFEFIPPFVIDIVDLARHYDARMSHHLKDLAKLFGLSDKGDTGQFKGFHWEDMSDFQRLNLEMYADHDIWLEAELFEILWNYLTTPEIEIPLARHTLKLFLQPRFKFDEKGAVELQEKMSEVFNNIIEPTGLTKKQLGTRKEFPIILQKLLPEGETVPTKQGKNGVICALAKDDVGMQLLLAHSDKKVRELCEARIAIKSWPTHIARVKNMATQAECSDGLLRCALNYNGAHTGRFSGGEKINLQNLGGRGRVGSGNHPLLSSVRKLLGTPDGWTLLISDSAQIEARVLAWFAGQSDLLQDFAEGESPYCSLATELFGEKIYKPSDEEKKTTEGQAIAIKYGFGKDGILGCGFGMGAKKFYDRCRSNPDLRPLFDSGQYNFAFIERLIKTYRTKYMRIPEFWKAVELAFKWVVKYPHETRYLRISNTGVPESKLIFWNDCGTVNLQLPSGRVLYYRHCSINKKKELRWHHGHLWGGSITENIVQATARDLLAYWLLECEHIGLPIIFHNHDELVAIVTENYAGLNLNLMKQTMLLKPDWAFGLPLGVEGEISKVYKK